ncbi:ABC transporter ATP-binding protein [Bailinhaonella thermotolerans]|uniref:ABC transporter ATP-binding protein n=1 Tax=Bailinhaonella thermotolerans TaxID=1070861 RepID=A0A3A4B7N5_9ACTN|nr:ABC transporter ATP-binding protein [Bailinhaonella thermotolerans]RJL34241.1 ABC transporter ATP-binding protein [Bailinhaonella thermotolerans]
MAIIEVTDLTKKYGGRPVVDGVSFHVDEGEIFGILGPNGAGKTTTVECVEGLRRPDAGHVRVLGADPHGPGAAELRQGIGVQLQRAELPDHITVREALGLYASFYRGPADPDELVTRWGLAEKRDSRYSTLSGGQKQRLFIALALVGNPRVAFLDELTTGLDPQARRATWRLVKDVRDAGVTVVLVSHFMDEVEELCDRVAILERGRITALDTPSGLIERAGGAQRLRFRPLAPLDDSLISGLPGVTGVSRTGGQVEVTGNGDFASEVTTALARNHILVSDLRLERAGLDEAYVTLTGSTLDTEDAK